MEGKFKPSNLRYAVARDEECDSIESTVLQEEIVFTGIAIVENIS
jgi:hypothetical protein